ncbi:MAG: class I SAM-dependent methyltransferase [Armatimonadota bacterium]
MRQPWLIDELAYAGQEHLDPGFVAGYDRKQGYPDAAEDLAVFGRHGLDFGSTILDFGAGTGQFALAAARQFARVIAVDVSPIMVQVMLERAADAGLVNVDAIQAGFLSYEHRGPPLDGVFTRNALHHLPDFWKGIALVRIAALLRPGGILRVHDLIYDFAPSEADAVFDRWFNRAVDDPASGYTATDFAEHIRTEFSTFRWLFEPILAAAGFEILSAEFSGSVYGVYTCRKQ